MEREKGHSRQPKKKLFYEWYINSKIQRSAVINKRSSPWLIKRDIKALKGRNSITRGEAPGSKNKPQKAQAEGH